MSFLHYLWSFLLALGVLIFVHELGHYLAARWCGVRVLRFAIGFGRPIWSRQFGADRTEWCIGLFPLGGYVKMLDEREDPVPEAELTRAFNRQPIWKRSVIVAAGPVANFLLAIAVYWALFSVGTLTLAPIVGSVLPDSAAARSGLVAGERIQRIGDEPVRAWEDLRWAIIDNGFAKRTVEVVTQGVDGSTQRREADFSQIVVDERAPDPVQQFGVRPPQPDLPPIIGSVAPRSPAEAAGIKAGDKVIQIDAEPVANFRDVAEKIAARPAKTVQLRIQRGAETLDLTATPEAAGEGERKRGRLGIAARPDERAAARYLAKVSYPPLEALGRAVEQTWKMSVFSLKVLWRMITGEVSLRNVSGPLSIADYAGQSASVGFEAYLKFLALISISLGVLNLLPVPILDGGHLLYHAIEAVTGKPLSERALELAQRCGLALLLGLMALAMFNDLNRLLFR